MTVAAAIPTRADAKRRWQPYAAERPAPVPWLGSVPEHWNVKRLKYTVRLVNEKTEDPAGLPYVGLEHIESWTGRYLEPDTPVQPDGMSNHFGPDDVLFGKLRPYLAKVLHARDAGVCTSEALVLRSRLLRPTFLFYWLLNRDLVSVVDGSTYGSKMPRANWEFIGNLPTFIPPLDEQRTIAAFLDRETARIDALIAKKRRLIELLQEKRTALIGHVVTKGLDPNAPMKPSGIDWPGTIPQAWQTKRLKYVFLFLNNRRVPLSALERADMERTYPYYGASGIIDHVDSYLFDEPLILVAEDGANLYSRSTPLAFVASGQYWVNNHAHILKPRYGPLTFWEALLQAVQYDPWISGSAQPKLTKENLGSIPLPIPPEREIAAIADFIVRTNGQLSPLIAAASNAIDRLREYRSALISAAVTGKIDVRNCREDTPCQ